jgi:hypothetical protein
MEGKLIEECLLEGRPIMGGFIEDLPKEEGSLEEPLSERPFRIRLHRGMPYRGVHLEAH